jgi:hypothetical protein
LIQQFSLWLFCYAERSKSICILTKKELSLILFAHSDAFAALSMTKKRVIFPKQKLLNSVLTVA